MSRILKSAPAPHVVIVDTNALWHKEKHYVVSPDFEKAWDEACRLASLELVIPETVRGELLFQQTSSAWKHLDKIADSLAGLSSITSRSHSTKIRRDAIRQQVTDRFDKWVRTKRARVAPTPVATIDWKSLASDAIWRETPFIPDPKAPEAEKGFRDALIMHTVESVVAAETRAVNLVFICGDHTLQRATAARLKSHSRFSSYDDFAGFESYIKLTQQKLTNAFIAAILDRAAEKFYTADDLTCLFYRERLVEKLRSQFREHFDQPDRSETPDPLFGTSSFVTYTPWTPTDTGAWALAKPEFVSLDDSTKRYVWLSRLTFTRSFQRQTLFAGIQGVSSSPSVGDLWNSRLLSLTFDIKWQARVKSDARFHDTTILSTTVAKHSFNLFAPSESARYTKGTGMPG